MRGKFILTSVVLGLLTVGAGTTLADPNGMRPGHPGGHNGYIPWRGDGFGYGLGYGGDSSSNNAQQQAQVYNLAPAMGQAAFAEAEFDNRWTELQILVDRARREFQISEEYLNSSQNLQAAQHDYDAAVSVVVARLQNDKDYKNLIEKRTEQQLALKSTGVDTGLRNAVATEKLRYSSMATQLEAVALSNDSAVRDARTRLVSAGETLRLAEKKFELQLYHQPDVAAARNQMETARANKAGADGYLYGAYVTRADQLNLNDQYNTGNNVYLGGWGPYARGYYGLGAF